MNEPRLCESCGAKLRANNIVGVCRRPGCRATYARRYRELFPDQREKENARTRRYAKDKDPQAVREYNKQWKRDNPIKQALYAARGRAKQAGLEFDLTEDTIPPIPEVCPVLGIKLAPGDGRMCDSSPTLDRIDSKRGYTPDNVHWISWRANSLKKDATLDELVKLAEYFTRLTER